MRSRSCRELTAAANLRWQGYPTFLPVHAKTVRHARRFRSVRAAFFPGYLFVQLTIGRDRWRSVNGTVGVAHMIMEGERPKPVPPGVVEALIAAADGAGCLAVHPQLQCGEMARVVSGPFAGLVGRLTALDEGKRVAILLDVLGTGVSVAATRLGLVAA